MMKQATLAAPRSTAATIFGGARAALRPSRPFFGSAFLAASLRASAGRSAVLSIGGPDLSLHALGGRRDGGGCGEGGDGLRCARTHGDGVGVAQVDALEAQFEDARAQV